MSSDLLAPAPAGVLSPHSLAAALNAGVRPAAPVAVPAAPAARALDALDPVPEPGEGIEEEEARAGMLMFRVGPELFAASLAEVDEAIELAIGDVTPLPEMPRQMLGVVRLRGVTLPLFSPALALGVHAGAPQAALIVRDGARRIALAIDDVEDVIELRDRDLRPSPDADADRLLRGVAHLAGRLVSTIDVGSLVAACASATRSAA